MANRRGAFIVLPMSDPSLSAHRRIVLAGEGARPTFGSPALRNGEYCYFHRRLRMTTVDLSHSAHHVTTEFVLPLLEDAQSNPIPPGLTPRFRCLLPFPSLRHPTAQVAESRTRYGRRAEGRLARCKNTV